MDISNAQTPKVYGSPTCASFTPIISRSSLSALCTFLEEIECVPEFALSVAGELYLKQLDGRFLQCPEEFANWIVSLETQSNSVSVQKEQEKTVKHQATQTQADTLSLDDPSTNVKGSTPAKLMDVDLFTVTRVPDTEESRRSFHTQIIPETSGKQSMNLQQRFSAMNSNARANLLAISDLHSFAKACYLQVNLNLGEHISLEGKACLYRIQAGDQLVAETKAVRRVDAVLGGLVKAVEFLDLGIMEDWRKQHGDPLRK